MRTWGFTRDDYLRHFDGKPRYDGVAAFLASRGVELPWGSPDADMQKLAEHYGAAK